MVNIMCRISFDSGIDIRLWMMLDRHYIQNTKKRNEK